MGLIDGRLTKCSNSYKTRMRRIAPPASAGFRLSLASISEAMGECRLDVPYASIRPVFNVAGETGMVLYPRRPTLRLREGR